VQKHGQTATPYRIATDANCNVRKLFVGEHALGGAQQIAR
jgi:hypothetical protein